MVIYVQCSNKDLGKKVISLLNRKDINYIESCELSKSIERRVLLSIILLFDKDSLDQTTMKSIFELKKKDIPIIVVYSGKNKEFLNIIKNFRLISLSLEEFNLFLGDFLDVLKNLDREYEKDLSNSEGFIRIYRKSLNDILHRHISDLP